MHSRKLLIRCLKQYPVWVFLTSLLGLSSAVFNGVGVALIIPILLSFLGQDVQQNTSFPPILNQILSIFDGVPDTYRTLVMAATVVMAIIFKNLANYASTLTSNALNRSFSSNLRKEGIRLLLDVDMSYFNKFQLGDLMNRINNEVNRTTSAVRSLMRIAVIAITIIVFLGILIAISWQLTLVSTVLMGGIALLNQYSVRQAKSFGKELSRTAGALSSHLIEMLSGIRLVKATANEEREYKILEDLIRRRERAEFRSQLVFASIAPVNEISSILAIIGIVAAGRVLFTEQIQAFSPVILTYLLVLFRTLPFVAQLNTQRSQLANASASVDLVSDFLRRDNKPFMVSGTVPFSRLNTGIRFVDVSFHYPGSTEAVLSEVTLDLPKGTTLALVGHSGAGKSTLADLLARFYDPSQGSIEIDGIDLRRLDVKSFRRRLGIVSQDTFLFNASVRNNIKYGSPEATDGEIIEAAKLANAYEFILRLPQGLDTPIGDRGVLLSGGQRQRLAIARALIQDPEILILDEATSALDTVSERLVQEAIDALSRDRTTLVIAHRLSTVRRADQIAVLEAGHVVEVGTHTELLGHNGPYAELHAIQFADHPADTNGASTDASLQAVSQASHNLRSHLNNLLGCLGLLAESPMEETSEQAELTQAALQEALNMFKAIETWEKEAETASTRVAIRN
ncbi:uncharacterized protein XM38_005970 [Halomicronema hongdechloris C2206]|uniref:ABC transporter ATP-binding protein n=1 Tax=Halomicronema hongdechloris C2206 TaxID=1641165 RepID=A0A1Z3HHD2_9CYAN|nr:ABC transporter ATP-binding protein [Halomicronema hongdechloris]ASC69668.1 uncharacterized protein XM38_005970 [Halomicronema hongdechloris C2206]